MKFYSKGYTLWLMPKGQIYSRFQKLIKKLADENNGPYFEPHITLLGEIELPEDQVIAGVKRLVKDQQPFIATLGKIGYEDYHFRALFVKAVITPQLQDLHNKAKEIFQINIPPYMAHLSLLYGHYPNQIKEKIIKEIGKDQSCSFEVSSIFIKKAGDIEDWKIIKEIPFTFSSHHALQIGLS